MAAHEIGPEFSDTTSHVIDISIQILHRLERGDIVGRFSRKDDQIHFHPLREGSHQLLQATAIFPREGLQKPEAIFQSLQQLPFGRILLERSHSLLDITDLRPRNLVANELRFQLGEIVESSWPIDQFGIGDRISGAREEVCEADLIADIRRNHNQGRIEEAGDSLEQIAQKC